MGQIVAVGESAAEAFANSTQFKSEIQTPHTRTPKRMRIFSVINWRPSLQTVTKSH